MWLVELYLGAKLMSKSRYFLLLSGFCCLTAPSIAQSRDEVQLQVAATGFSITAADKVTVVARITSKGETVADARTANTLLFDKVMAAVARAGAPTNGVRIVPPTRAMGFVGNEQFDPEIFEEAMGGSPVAAMAAKPKPSITNMIEVRLPNATLYEKVRDALESSGAKSVSGPNYQLSDDGEARRAAKADALKRAQVDAKSYADPLGMKIARISRITEGGVGDFASMMQNAYQQMANQSVGSREPVLGEVKTVQSISVEFVLMPK
jgi:uncharacterized protein YggE